MAPSFVPTDFEVPRSFAGDGFRLEPLGPEHNDRDHAAWKSSIDHIRATPGFESQPWPVEMSLQRNREDLVGHAKDFDDRTGFTYSILDGDDVIGCVYIYPSRRRGHDAEVTAWVRETRIEMDAVVWRSVSGWLETTWPFSSAYFATRA